MCKVTSPFTSHVVYNNEFYTEITEKVVDNVRPGQYINIRGEIYTPSNSIYKFRYPVYGNNRYARVKVYRNDGSIYQGSMHRILMLLFSYVDNNEELVVNHKNGNKFDNDLTNLEWTTNSGNMIHAAKHNLIATGEDSHFSKLTEKEVREICIELEKPRFYGQLAGLASKYNVTEDTIHNIANGGSWYNISKEYNIDYSLPAVESILTENQVREICEELSKGRKRGQYKELGDKYNVSPSTIKQIAYRESWTSISCEYEFDSYVNKI